MVSCEPNQKGKRFAERGGENIEYVVLQRNWGYKEKISDKKRIKQTDQMMRSILMHAYPECSEQRSTSARASDPKNQDKMKRRRARVVHTNWDNLNGEMEWL